MREIESEERDGEKKKVEKRSTDDDDASSGAALAHLSELVRSAEARGEVIAHRLIRCPPLGALDVLLRW